MEKPFRIITGKGTYTAVPHPAAPWNEPMKAEMTPTGEVWYKSFAETERVPEPKLHLHVDLKDGVIGTLDLPITWGDTRVAQFIFSLDQAI